MKRYIIVIPVIFTYLLCINSTICYAQKKAPPSIAGALILKLLPFNINLKGEINCFVLGDEELAKELQKGVGKKIGNAILKNVASGNELPATKPEIFIICNDSKIEDILKYIQENKIMSITTLPDLTPKGISLGIGVGDDGKPKILLNLGSSKVENIDWNPAIIKIAKTLK